MQPIDTTAVILAIIGVFGPILMAWINRKSVPAAAAQAMADSVPAHTANVLANCTPPAPPAKDEAK